MQTSKIVKQQSHHTADDRRTHEISAYGPLNLWWRVLHFIHTVLLILFCPTPLYILEVNMSMNSKRIVRLWFPFQAVKMLAIFAPISLPTDCVYTRVAVFRNLIKLPIFCEISNSDYNLIWISKKCSSLPTRLSCLILAAISSTFPKLILTGYCPRSVLSARRNGRWRRNHRFSTST